MRVNFRQGIIRRQTNLTAPDFLRKTSLSGNSIDLIVSPEPTVISIAHYEANYLFEETRTVEGAWGGDAPGSLNGPLTATGQTQYLFWDVDLATGQLTRGWTLVPPIINATEPANPLADTHWFDTVVTRMRVFRQPNPGQPGVWQDKVRLFAAIYDSSANIIPYPLGSQVGISGGEYSTGNLVLAANNRPLRQQDGTFVTTETNLTIYQTSGQNVRFDAALMFAMAAEQLPKFSCVSFLPNRTICLASSSATTRFVSGIITEDLYQDEVGQIITGGIVRNEQWGWTPDQINAPLFINTSGQLTLRRPLVGVVQQVGYVYDQDSIYFNLFPPVRLR